MNVCADEPHSSFLFICRVLFRFFSKAIHIYIYIYPTLYITVMSTASLTGDAQPVNTSNNLNRSRHAHLVFPAYLPVPNFVYQYNYVNRFNLVAEEVD